ARPIACDNTALRLLLHYAEIVREDEAMATVELRQAVTAHFYELAALAIGASADTVQLAHGGVRAARLRAIKADIRRALSDSALTLNDLASRHGVTPRYV